MCFTGGEILKNFYVDFSFFIYFNQFLWFLKIAVIESAYAIKRGKTPIQLSQQQIVDCSYHKYKNKDGTTGNNGCQGGYGYDSLYYAQQYPIELASRYPYVQKLQSCKYSASLGVVHVTGIYSASTTIGNYNAMRNVVWTQPLMVYIYVTSDFYSYKSGLYFDL